MVATRTNATPALIVHCKFFILSYITVVDDVCRASSDVEDTYDNEVAIPDAVYVLTVFISTVVLTSFHFSYESDGSVDTRPEVERTPARP